MANPVITFGASQVLGTITGWNEQQPSSGTNLQRKFSLGLTGNETADKTLDNKTEVTVPYVAATAGTVALPGTIGAVVNSLMLTSIQVNTTAEDFARLTLVAHDHNDGNPHDGSENSGTHAIPNINGFGATDFLNGTAGDNASLASSSLTIKCEHVDILGGTGTVGTHTAGENYHAMIEAECVWNGVPTSGVGTTWTDMGSETKTNNQGFLQTTCKGVKTLALS